MTLVGPLQLRIFYDFMILWNSGISIIIIVASITSQVFASVKLITRYLGPDDLESVKIWAWPSCINPWRPNAYHKLAHVGWEVNLPAGYMGCPVGTDHFMVHSRRMWVRSDQINVPFRVTAALSCQDHCVDVMCLNTRTFLKTEVQLNEIVRAGPR